MDLEDIKKALAGVCVAALLSGAGLTLFGCASQPPQKKEAGTTG
jgi:radical SAM modification target selenobiotic family peptide